MADKMWMVRAGKDGVFFDDFKEQSMVAVLFSTIGDIQTCKTKDDLREIVNDKYPDHSNQQKAKFISMLNSFRFEMKKSDMVVTFNKEEGNYMVGKIVGFYKYDEDATTNKHRRAVEWNKHLISRTTLSESLKNSLGGLATIFSIKEEHLHELMDKCNKPSEITPPATDEDELTVEPDSVEDLEEKIKSAIDDKIDALSALNMENLVAALLRAMNLPATITAQTKDGGYDVYASPDGLMFEEPRIRAEVKHQQGKIGREDMQKFIQAKGDSRGLYVSTGGFNELAKAEARSNEIMLVDKKQLRELIIKHYDNFDIEGRVLLPLKKLYLPME